MSAVATSYWNYVAAGYAITVGVIAGYSAWLLTKLRRARASLPAESPEDQRR